MSEQLKEANGRLTMDTLLMNTGLKYMNEQVDQEITEIDLPKIADLFDNIDDLCEQLGLSAAEKEDVETQQGIKESAKKALKYWREQDPLKATFKNLLTILLANDKEGVAKKVAHYISNRPQPRETNKQQPLRPKKWTERQVCTFMLVLLAVGIVLLSMALFTKDQDRLPVLTMADFEQYRTTGAIWYSPPVYTHHQGYKICLRVDANGNGAVAGKGTYVSVYVYFMRGEFDDSLEWPFRGVISYQLLDQVNGKDRKTHTIVYDNKTSNPYCTRVTNGERSPNGWGTLQFIAHTELEPKYLRNDTLLFQIHKVELN